MNANNSSRRRSRPVEKKSATKKLKRNKPAMFLSIFIVLMLVISGFVVIISQFTGNETNEVIDDDVTNNTSIDANDDEYFIWSNSENKQLKVLDNDEDKNNSELKIIEADDALYGEISLNEKYLSYTPNENAGKKDSITYTVSNELNQTTTATVEVNIRPNAIISTSIGEIKVGLYIDKVPNTVDNFIKLANSGFYDGLVFHRVIDDFMIQGGGFKQDGSQKESPYGSIDLEINKDIRHVDGTISMARTNDPNSATSQFFICDGDQSFLDDQYAAFGIVLEGMDIVRSIASVETTTKHSYYSDWPVEEVIINNIEIENN